MSNKVKFIAFANDHNEPMLINLVRSLKKFNYDYAIIGKGAKWEGFMTKVRGYLNYVNSLPPDQLVICADAYDVLATGPSDKIIAKYRSYRKPLVVGCESYCGANCIPVENWWKNTSRGKLQYVNSGFFMGTAFTVAKALNYMLSLDISDDQEALCIYVNEYPDEVALDTDAKIISNITPLDLRYLDFRDGMIYNQLTNQYPSFVHTPGKTGDWMIRTNYVGRNVLGDEYLATPTSETFNEFTKKVPMFVKKNYYVVLTLLVLLFIILVLISAYNPRLFPVLLFIFVLFAIFTGLFYTQCFKYV